MTKVGTYASQLQETMWFFIYRKILMYLTFAGRILAKVKRTKTQGTDDENWESIMSDLYHNKGLIYDIET